LEAWRRSRLRRTMLFVVPSWRNMPQPSPLGSLWGERLTGQSIGGSAADAPGCPVSPFAEGCDHGIDRDRTRGHVRRPIGRSVRRTVQPDCRIELYLGSRRRLRRRWPSVSAGLSVGDARPAHAGPYMQASQIRGAHRQAGTVAGWCCLPRRTIVPLLAAASRSLPAVASLRDRCANLDPASTRQGFGGCGEDGAD